MFHDYYVCADCRYVRVVGRDPHRRFGDTIFKTLDFSHGDPDEREERWCSEDFSVFQFDSQSMKIDDYE